MSPSSSASSSAKKDAPVFLARVKQIVADAVECQSLKVALCKREGDFPLLVPNHACLPHVPLEEEDGNACMDGHLSTPGIYLRWHSTTSRYYIRSGPIYDM
ncbi:hypothetical protein V8D89_000991 [Ganoderma adspersum]